MNHAGIATLIMMTLLAAACSRQPTNSEGNGPGTADGVGGREDPPTAPAANAPEPTRTPPRLESTQPPAEELPAAEPPAQ